MEEKQIYRNTQKVCELPSAGILRACVHREDTVSLSCCSRTDRDIRHVVVHREDGRKEIFRFESMEEARELLARIQAAKLDPTADYLPAKQSCFEG